MDYDDRDIVSFGADEPTDYAANEFGEEVEPSTLEEPPKSRLRDLKERGRQRVSRVAERGRERLHGAADRGRTRLADAIESTADNLDSRLSHGAEYLRTHEINVIRDDLVSTIRKRPLLSAGVALGAGYLLGRTLRLGPRRKRGRVRKTVSRQINRAVVSSLGALLASRARRRTEPLASDDLGRDI